MTDETKVCSKCGETKLMSLFSKASTAKDGLSFHCKECRSRSNKLWMIKNREKRRQYDATTYQRKRLEILERKKIQRMDGPNKFKEQSRAAYWANPEKYRLYQTKFLSLNHEKVRSKLLHRRENLSDSYVVMKIIRDSVVRAADVPRWLIDAKREQLKLYRLTKQLKQTINEVINQGESK